MLVAFSRGKILYDKSQYVKYFIKFEKSFDFPKSLGDFNSTGVASNDTFSSLQDGDPVVLTYNNFTVNENHIVTVSNRCKGLYLNILGDLIVNGSLSMTARGAYCEGKYIYIDKFSKNIYYSNEVKDLSDFDIEMINKAGGLGTTNKTSVTSVSVGGAGINGACAAGGR